MKKVVRGFHFWLLVAVVGPFVTVSAANIAGLDWVIFKDELDFTRAALLVLPFFVSVIIAAWGFGFKWGVIACFALGALMCLQVIDSPRSWDYLPGFTLIVAIGIGASFLIDRQEKGKRLLNQSAEELERRVGELDHELTERKRMEESLKESRRRYLELANLLPQSVWETDERANFTFVNHQGFQVHGYALEEITEPLNALQVFIPENRDRVAKNIQRILSGEELGGIEYTALRKDGSTFPVLVYATPIIRGDRAVGLRGVTVDITERKRTEAELVQTMSALTRSNTELQQFAYIASHDLQEPLRMVASYVQLLARRYKGQLDKDADDFIAYAVDGATRMQHMINELLKYSRVNTQGKEFQPTSCEDVFNQVVANLQLAIEESGALVTRDPLPTIMADESQLVQLFQNLTANAIMYHNQESPRVHVSAEQKGNEWVFSVSDNGIGIELQDFDRIFQLFQRSHSANYPGAGIGLAICRRIVERHGGRIWVESEIGKGSMFYFVIPVKEGV